MCNNQSNLIEAHKQRVPPPGCVPTPGTAVRLDTFTPEPGDVSAVHLVKDPETGRLFLDVQQNGPGPLHFPIPLAEELTARSLEEIDMQIWAAHR